MDVVYEAGGVKINTDAPAAHGGIGEFPTPVALLGESLAACALTTASMAAAQAGVTPDGFRAEVEGITTDDDTHSVKSFDIRFHFAKDMEASVRKRVEAFTERACIVGNALNCEKHFVFEYDV